MCVVADWWQVGRAFGGNSLSFLYAIEWPCFAVLGLFGWWQLLHVEKPTEDQELARREFEERMRAEAAAGARRRRDPEERIRSWPPTTTTWPNSLIAPKKKLWGH